MFKTLALVAALVVAPMAAHTQNKPVQSTTAAKSTAPALTAEQRAMIAKQDQQVTQAALQIALLVDKGKIGQVWDNASSVAKQASPRADFTKQIKADRTRLGTLDSRQAQGVTRIQSNGKNFPSGLYLNVVFASKFKNASKPVRELISFHLDNDKVWRLAGYTLR